MGAMANGMASVAGKLPGGGLLSKLPGINKLPGIGAIGGKGLQRQKQLKAAPGQLTPQTAMGGQMAGPQGLMAGGGQMGMAAGLAGGMAGQPTTMPPATQQMTPGAAAPGAFQAQKQPQPGQE